MKISKQKRLLSGFGALSVLALVLAPAGLVSAADNTTIDVNVLSSITLNTSGTVSLYDLTPGASAVISSDKDTVTVSTNNSTGYYLTLADTDADTDMDNVTDNIAKSANTFAAPDPLAANTWGYAIAAGTGFDASYSLLQSSPTLTSQWAGIAASGSPQTIKTTSSEANNDQTEVWYAVSVNSSQPTGAYNDNVTYTAVANP